MTMTMTDLEKLAKGAGLRYFLDPQRPALMFGFQGMNGSYQILLLLEDIEDGPFLQFRSIGSSLYCPEKHPHLLEALKVIGSLNYNTRLVRFGWDPNDGEIIAQAQMWISDGMVGPEQFKETLQNYCAVLDRGFGRLKQTLETGHDPGDEDIRIALQRTVGQVRNSLPPALRELLDKLGVGGGPNLQTDI
ncbi:YbjN domain-containing protein [Gammaproteobacteria bacterium]